jgi:YfiH family protein
MAALDLPEAALVTGYQVHSSTVVAVEAPWPPDARPEADGLVTGRPRLALGILTADCAPVLFAEPHAGVIAAAHAGWKGALGGILESTLESMHRLGAIADRTVAAIGPCIAQASYEVGPEFLAAFRSRDAANERFFAPSERPRHFLFNLPGYVAHRLELMGLAAVEALPFDTCADETRFFSYRRATKRGERDYGRQLSAIALSP